MSFEYQLVHEHSFILETLDGCTNTGAACYSCPAFDNCDHATDNEEDFA